MAEKQNISCPVSPIGSPLLHPGSPQHLNGMMSPSPISIPCTTSGSSTPLTGGSGAIPFHHSQQSLYMHEGFGALSKSPNSVFLNGPCYHDPSPNLLRGMQSGPRALTALVITESDVHSKQVERREACQGAPCNGLTVLADLVSQQLLREHAKQNPPVEFSPRSTLPGNVRNWVGELFEAGDWSFRNGLAQEIIFCPLLWHLVFSSNSNYGNNLLYQ